MDSPPLLHLQIILQLSLTLSVKSQFMPPFPFPQMGQMGQIGRMGPMGQMGLQMGPQMGPMRPMSYGMPMPGMPPPMGMPMPQQKLPVVVMPYHSKASDKNQKRGRRRKEFKRKRRYESHDSDCDSDSTDDDYRRHGKSRRSGKEEGSSGKRQVLTPVVSYVTKDGYVVFQKKISKNEPNDWLGGEKQKLLSEINEEMGGSSSEERHQGLSFKRSSKRRRGH